MRETLEILRHPLRRPEWLEVIGGLCCLAQTVISLSVYDELPDRVNFTIAILLLPNWLWAILGFLIAAGHITAIRMDNLYVRSVVSAVGFGFWFHMMLSLIAASLFFDAPAPLTLGAVISMPMVYGALAWKLWGNYGAEKADRERMAIRHA